MASESGNKPEDRAPEGDRSRKADAPPVEREPDAPALTPSVDPELPHPKPEPKAREPG